MRRFLVILLAFGATAVGCGTPDQDVDTTASATTSPVTTSPVTTSPVTTSPATTSAVTTSPITTSVGITVDPSLVAAPADVPTASATVLRVVDGDSLEVELGGVVTELRLVGINAPEGDECHGDTSRDTLESIVTSAGGIVEVAENDEERDQFGRLLGYVSADGVDINALLLATGNAMALQSGHVRQNGYLRLTEAAFADGAGMWRLGACGAATVDRGDVRIVAVEPDPPGRDEERLVDELVVIGNSSDRAVDLSGWTLRDDSTANRYVFPTGVVLDQGSEVTVRVGCGRDDALTRFWCSDTPVWSNDGDSVVLLDASGNVIDLLVYRG